VYQFIVPKVYQFSVPLTGTNGQIINSGGTIINLDAPAAPLNLTATASGTYQPVVLNWTANTENDLDKYKIYRASNYSPTPPSSGYGLIATVNAFSGGNPVTSYTDNETFAYTSSWWVHYKIKAQDTAGNVSGSSNIDSYNAVLFKTAAGDEEQTVQAFRLLQNYPNPFNPATTIAFALPEKASVRLQVFDLNGKLVKELVNQELTAGTYEASLDATHLGSGIYVYRLTAGAFSQTHKMMLIK